MRASKKDGIQLIIKLVAIGLILLFLFNEVGYLLDGASRCYPTGKTAEETDVVLIGSSHIYCDIIPQKLYDDYGITAYDVAPAEPGIKASYYAMKEVINSVQPQVIVVELLMMYENSVESDNMNFKTNLVHEMSLFSPVHYEAAIDCEESYEIGYDYYFDILRAHTNYNDLTKDNFDKLSGTDLKAEQLGYKSTGKHKKAKDSKPYNYGDQPSAGYEPIAENVEYLDKMMALASSKGVNVVFLLSPDSRADHYDAFKWVDAHVQESGYRIYDFNTVEERETIEFDLETDMADTNHLNDSGALKYTEEIGSRLTSLFDLEDHRGQAGYEAWNSHQYNYESVMSAAKLSDTDNLADYLDLLAQLNTDYVITICAREQVEALSRTGVIDTGVEVLNGNAVQYDEKSICTNINTDKYDLNLGEEEEPITISINNKSKYSDEDAIACILVYCSRTNEVVDSRSIGSDGEFM